jgi:hypothetical protein
MRKKYGVYPGLETPLTPDEPDVLAAGGSLKENVGEPLMLGYTSDDKAKVSCARVSRFVYYSYAVVHLVNLSRRRA